MKPVLEVSNACFQIEMEHEFADCGFLKLGAVTQVVSKGFGFFGTILNRFLTKAFYWGL